MIYRRVLRYYRPFLAPTVAGLLLTLVGIGVNLLKPWPFKFIVDQILPADSSFRLRHADWRHYIPLLCLALIGLQLLWGIINLITNYIFVKIGLQALLKLRTDLYAYLQSLSLKYHDARRSAIRASASPTIRRPSRRSTTRASPTFLAPLSRSSAPSSSCCGSTGSSRCCP